MGNAIKLSAPNPSPKGAAHISPGRKSWVNEKKRTNSTLPKARCRRAKLAGNTQSILWELTQSHQTWPRWGNAAELLDVDNFVGNDASDTERCGQ